MLKNSTKVYTKDAAKVFQTESLTDVRHT